MKSKICFLIVALAICLFGSRSMLCGQEQKDPNTDPNKKNENLFEKVKRYNYFRNFEKKSMKEHIRQIQYPVYPISYKLFVTVIMLAAISVPFVIRYVLLRRPIISLWYAILFSLIGGFLMTVFLDVFIAAVFRISLMEIIYSTTDINEFGYLYLYLGFFFAIYFYLVTHIGYTKCLVEKVIREGEKDKREKDKVKNDEQRN